MNTILPCDPLQPAPASASAENAAAGVSRRSQVVSARSESLAVAMTTSDGDRFTLSSSEITGSGATYSPPVSAPPNLMVARSNIEASLSATRVAVSLRGDLSSEEARDLAKGLKEVIKVFRDLESGHLKQAVHRTEKLAKLSTLASVEASFQSSTATEVTL